MEEKNDILEKMLAGEAVSMADPDYLGAAAFIGESWKRCQEINCTPMDIAETRQAIIDKLHIDMPETSFIVQPFHIDNPKGLELGNNVFINYGSSLMACGRIIIEDNVQIGPNTMIVTTNHDFTRREVVLHAPVTIKKGAWIGGRSLILPGVTIGENAVVAGGAVVTKDVEPNTIVGGNPAKVIKRLDPK